MVKRLLGIILVSMTIGLAPWIVAPRAEAHGLPAAPPPSATPLTFKGWGENNVYGQLTAPALVNPTAIAAGDNHVVVLQGDGTVKSWGSNTHGQSTVPTGLSGVVAIAAGGDSSMALRADGTAVAWGLMATSGYPALTGVKAISVRDRAGAVVHTDGSVASWGLAGTPAPTLTDAVSVSVGTDFVLGLRSNGKVVAWGNQANPAASDADSAYGITQIAAGGTSLVLGGSGALKSLGSYPALVSSHYVGVDYVAVGPGRLAIIDWVGAVADQDLLFPDDPPSPVVTGARAVAVGSRFTVALVGDPYTPPTPSYEPLIFGMRIMDTRAGFGFSDFPIPLAPHEERRMRISSVTSRPATELAGVAVNITAIGPTAAGYLTVVPTGTVVPTASNLNFAAGQTVPNFAFVPVADDGTFVIVNGSPGYTHVAIDAFGYFTRQASPPPGSFTSLQPSRLLDTRSGTGRKVAPGGIVDLAVAGHGGVPASGVSAVVLNVTVTQGSASGHITVFPTGQAVPLASNLNFVAGQTVANLVVVMLGAGGGVSFNNGSRYGSSHVVADVVGYFHGGSPVGRGGYVPIPPTRVFDTRVNPGAKVGALTYPENDVIPNAQCAVGLVLNLTATEPVASGFFQVDYSPWIPTSSLNYTAGQTVPNLAITKAGFTLHNSGGPGIVHMIGDLAGYFAC